jgi:hypothetical protein
MERLAAQQPRVVVPGHGAIGGPGLLAVVRDYLRLLRDETWARRDSALDEPTITAEVRAVLTARYPDWTGTEWIDPAVRCLCTGHPIPDDV